MRSYWEITTKCNNSCDYCFNNSINHTKDLEKTTSLNNLIRILKTVTISDLIITGGEPCLVESLFSSVSRLKELFSKLEIRIITSGDWSLVSLQECIENKLIQGVTFTDHNILNRSARLKFIEKYRTSSIFNVIIPIHRKRINSISKIINEYKNAGCISFSLNILHYNIYNNQSICYAKNEELQKLLRINYSTPTIINKDSLVQQLKFVEPKQKRNNSCMAAKEFIYIDSTGNIKPCPYTKESILINELLSQTKVESLSELILQKINTFIYEKKKCMIHPGCVCINGSALI
jgi:MoaA/NifB/PqqE/SkfB family radical SAM enzyme